MRALISFLLLITISNNEAQNTIQGIIKDKKNVPIFAANIFLKNNPTKGTTSNFDGEFKLNVVDYKDTLYISYVGYKLKKIPLKTIENKDFVEIILLSDDTALEAIVLNGNDPISEKFSVTKLDKLDIYLNPISQGDPLKAITSLPASTNTDESANPSLRGSNSDRTRVALNGVPILNPVRNSQINGIGNFSIFNTEIINKQYVYASNPPLTYGNTSAGLVEIETIKQLSENEIQASSGLANVGLFASKKINKNDFLQVFSNYQFSDAFLTTNESASNELNTFESIDVGLNFHKSISKKTRFNSFNYFINESFNVNSQSFTFNDDASGRNKRFFSVNNLTHYTNNGILKFNSAVNFSDIDFSFGNIISNATRNRLYLSGNYKTNISDNLTLEFGGSYEYQDSRFNGQAPQFFFALSPESPSLQDDLKINNNNLEFFNYLSWDLNTKWLFSSGIRTNIPIKDQEFYLSYQLGIKHQITEKQSLIFGSGFYHNYTTPNTTVRAFNLQDSYQVSLDYTNNLNKTNFLKGAIYFKDESNIPTDNPFFSIDNQKIVGIEVFYETYFINHFKFSFANSFINQRLNTNGQTFEGELDLNYFIKTAIEYNNPKIATIALTYIGRPGTRFTSVVSSAFDEQTGFFIPEFSNEINDQTLANYNTLDLSISRFFQFNTTELVAFFTINNILDIKNDQTPIYNLNYETLSFELFQRRTIYFGLIWKFKN